MKKVILSVLMEYISGKTFYDLQSIPTPEGLTQIAHQAALISQIQIKPPPVYDAWSCTNFLKEFDERKKYLDEKDLAPVSLVADRLRSVDITSLPHCFVHGDIICPNVLRSEAGKIYILDFSVANYYPRIQELAVLFCNLFFDQHDPRHFEELYQLGLAEYQKEVPLTPAELELLPLYIQVAHAVHVLNPKYEEVVLKNDTAENRFWLELGQTGLDFSLKLWG